jgi:TatD family hydrolase
MYIDTHCHLFLQGTKFNFNPDTIVQDSIKAGVEQMWLAGTNKKDNKQNLEFAKKYPNNIKVWLGYHPEEAGEFDLDFLDQILKSETQLKTNKFDGGLSSIEENPLSKKLQIPNFHKRTKEGNLELRMPNDDEGGHVISSHSKLKRGSAHTALVGIGEVGVDLDPRVVGSKPISKITKKQQQVFEYQLTLAVKYNLPVAIHSRNAYEQTKEVLEKYTNLRILWHCYTLEKPQTEELLKTFNNIYFGFNAIITYKSGMYINESLKIIPQNKILLETDAPFLAPRSTSSGQARPFKYNYNTPEGVIAVYDWISGQLGVSVKDVKTVLTKNVGVFLNL